MKYYRLIYQLLFFILGILLILGSSSVALGGGCTKTWDGDAGDNDWNNAVNWNKNKKPKNGEAVCIDDGDYAAGDHPVISAVSTFEPDKINLTGDARLDIQASLTCSGDLSVDDNNMGGAPTVNIRGGVLRWSADKGISCKKGGRINITGGQVLIQKDLKCEEDAIINISESDSATAIIVNVGDYDGSMGQVKVKGKKGRNGRINMSAGSLTINNGQDPALKLEENNDGSNAIINISGGTFINKGITNFSKQLAAGNSQIAISGNNTLVTFGGEVTDDVMNGGIVDIDISDGTLVFQDAVTMEATDRITQSGSSNIRFENTATWTNDGSFTSTDGTISLNGSTTLSGVGSWQFDDVTINSGSSLTQGATDGASPTLISVSGDWLNDGGTFNDMDNTIELVGSARQIINNTSAPESFYNLTINNTHPDVDSGIVMLSGMDIENNLTMTNGSIDMVDEEITLTTTGTLVSETNDNRVYSGSFGRISATRTINNVDHFDPAGLRAAISTTENMGPTTITRKNLAETVGDNTGISLSYNIAPTNNSELAAHLHITYLDKEMTSGTETNFAYYYSTDGGITYNWIESTLDTETNSIESDNISKFAKWTISDYVFEPLPIELLYFEAEADGTDAILSWASDSETNNDFYTIERSSDGDDFEIIGYVDGAGNANNRSEYNYVDKDAPVGLSYYRLTQTDYDGQVETCGMVAVTIEGSDVLIYPNPNNGVFNVLVESNVDRETDVMIFNQMGQLIYQNEAFINNNLTVNISDHSSGIYIIKVISGSQIITKQIIYR